MLFSLLVFKVGKLSTNCYLLKKNGDCIVIDPGDEGDYISEKIQESNCNLKGIFTTHGHFDHILSSGYLGNIYDLPLYAHKNDLFLINRMNESASFWLKSKIKEIPPKVVNLNNKMKVLKDFDLELIEIPGHTPGGVGYYCKKGKFVISGDVIFYGGSIGRYDFSYSNKMDLVKSVEKILELESDTTIFPGHGDKTSVKEEIKYFKKL